jgi:hypothetical protein
LENRLVPPGGGAPLTFDGGILAQPGLSYAAFGGRSEVEVLELEHGVCLGYAGAPDAHGFDERGDHYYLEVVLGQGEPDITAVPSQSVVFEEHEVNCSHLDGVDAVARALRELPRESDTGKSGVETVGRVRLTGESATAWRDCAGEVAEAVCDRFSMLDLIDETAPVLDVSGGEARTSLEAFAQRMSEAFRDAPDGGQRALMRRALQTGLAAFRDEPLPIPGVDEG